MNTLLFQLFSKIYLFAAQHKIELFTNAMINRMNTFGDFGGVKIAVK